RSRAGWRPTETQYRPCFSRRQQPPTLVFRALAVSLHRRRPGRLPAMKLFFVPVFQRFDTLLDGLLVTVLIAVLAIVMSMIAGLGLALARRSSVRPVRWLAVAYIDVFRNTPFVVQLFFFYFGLPEIG